jgi:putative ABC transport system permease protein
MTVWQDVRLAARLLGKDRWYTAVAILALGLGIGVNTTIFTFVNAVLIRGLPYADSNAILHISSRSPTSSDNDGAIPASYPDYQDWRQQSRSFEDLAAFRSSTMNVSDAERPPERTFGTWITANAFQMLGQPTLIGRGFLPGEDRPGTEPVAILGYGLWQTRYGGDENILERVIRVNEVPTKIVGVMPPGMKFPENAQMWEPLVPGAQFEKRSSRSLDVFGRLRPGISITQARAELSTIAARLAKQYPDSNRGFGVVVVTYNERFNGGPIKLYFLSLMGAVALVLLIACANVANLLLARSAGRAREMAVRVSLGATRWRIVRQLLIESVLLGCLAGMFGLALSVVGVRLFDMAVADVGKPYWIRFTMDTTVFAFLSVVCIATGILFGLAPALQVSRVNVNELLKEGGRSGGVGVRARRFSTTMVIVEVALTVVLLAGAGLMIRSFLNLYASELGFDTRQLMTAATVVPERKYPLPEQRIRFEEQLVQRIRAVPGVRAAAAATAFPLWGSDQIRIEVDRRPVTDLTRAPVVRSVLIGDGYFETLGVSLRRGRLFAARDGVAGSETAIVNERLVAQLFKNTDPIGRRVRILTDTGDKRWMTIVGVAPDLGRESEQQPDAAPIVYFPFRQNPSQYIVLLVRTAIDPTSVTQAVREAARDIDPDQPLYNLRSMEEVLAVTRWPWRVFGTMFAAFAGIALVLSAVGIYAVTAYSVAQRAQEIGVRIALGAERRTVSWMILRTGLWQLAVGVALGLVGAYFASGALRTVIVELSPTDPLTFVTITAVLLWVTILACLLPARRAMRVDPAVALRAE